MFHDLTIGRVLPFLLAAVLLIGCPHPGKTSQGLGRIEEEIRRNSELLQKDTTSMPVLVALGHAYIERARFGFERKADEYSDWYQVTYEDSSAKDLNTAIQVLERANRLHPDNEQVFAQLGYAFALRSRRFDDYHEAARSLLRGRQYLRRALEINPLSSLAHYYQGLAYYAPYGGMRKRVRFSLEKALALNPAFADAHYLLGQIDARDSARASHFHQALSLGLSDPLSTVRIGRFYEFGGGHDLGIWFTHVALRQVPEFARAVFGLGVMFFLKPDKQKAAELYARALEIDSLPEDTDILYNAGEILTRLGRRDEAEKYFDRINTLDPFAVEESYDQAQWYSFESRYGIDAYLKAARLGSKGAQDTLKNRNISW